MKFDPDWQPIATYPEGEFALLRDYRRAHFGKRDGSGWVEIVDDQLLPIAGFTPTEWAPCDLDQAVELDLIGP